MSAAFLSTASEAPPQIWKLYPPLCYTEYSYAPARLLYWPTIGAFLRKYDPAHRKTSFITFTVNCISSTRLITD